MSSKDLNDLSLHELKKLVKNENEEVKKLKEEKEKEKLILAYKKLQNKKEKLIQEKEVIKQKNISKSKSKSTSFQHYFQECIKDKVIPEDAPEYIKKALLKAKKEYEKGIILEKSALYYFAEKFDIKGTPGLIPIEFFREKASIIKDFLRNYQNTKVRMILVCLMEKKEITKDPSGERYDKRNFS